MTAKIIPMKRTNSTKAPPRKLGTHGQRLWAVVNEEVVLEDAAGVEMLLEACEALDRVQECAAEIKRSGVMLRTKTGTRENPLLKIELANRAFVTRTLARLGLDSEPIKTLGRPAARGYDGED
jgi:hypothetical protein